MTAAQPEISVAGGTRSLEVRWILPGQLEAAVTGWFARFPAWVESREDVYLVDPQLPGLSVKLRRGRALEVKVYQGSPGLLEVAGRARGCLESWDKWSFPYGPPGQLAAARPGWRPVRKLIRRFAFTGGQGRARTPRKDGEAGCEVELTEVRVHGRAWWTLGFEATGPAGLLRGELETTAALVFAQALPGGMELDAGDSQSYLQWLTAGPERALASAAPGTNAPGQLTIAARRSVRCYSTAQRASSGVTRGDRWTSACSSCQNSHWPN